MSETTLQEFVERKDFSRIRTNIDIPDLIEIQKRSYEEFLQLEVEPERRKDYGLQAALASVFPIPDYNNTAMLEFSSYTLGTPKYDERECLEQGMTFAVPLKLRVRLVVFDKEDKGPRKKVLDVREQEVYVGELPLMTERGTFIVNGTERVVVSQLHRSPGASFTHDKGRTHASGKVLYSARIIPYRGSWLDFEFDARDILYVRIDRRRKMPTTILLKAFGFSSDDLLKMYYPVEEIRVSNGKMFRKLDAEIHHGLRCSGEVLEKGGKEPLVREGTRLTKGIIAKLKAAGVKEIPMLPAELVGRAVLTELVDSQKTKLAEKNQRLTAEIVEAIVESGVEEFKVIYLDMATATPVILGNGKDQLQRRSDGGNLSPTSSGRNTVRRHCAGVVRQPVFEFQAIRSVSRRTAQAQQETGIGSPSGATHADRPGHRRSDPVPREPQDRQGRNRRHRPFG
jgi:DNA-directed RNA polymerase subunit beta